MKIADGAMARELCLPPELSSQGARRPPMPTASYCHACGTWDQHIRRCTCCGVDFDAQIPQPDEI